MSGRLAFVCGIAVLATLALALLLPSLKEGYDVEELPLFGGVTLGLLAVAFVTWKLLRSTPLLLAAGLACVGVPLAAYSLLTLQVLANEWRGRSLTRDARITSLRETPIEWPGFKSPVGLRLELELVHGVRMAGVLYAPKLRMAGADTPTRRDYFSSAAFSGIEAAFLQRPVFQDVGKPQPEGELHSSPSRLVFDLYPWKVQRYEAGKKVCFSKWDAERMLASAPGEDLGACWMFAGRSGTYVDLSAPLTAELRRTSRYQGRRAAWEELLRQLEPASLVAHGYGTCAEEQSGERCYCAPSPL